jgi:DNA-binding helix-hairpin-helix protein with protein kinase domain
MLNDDPTFRLLTTIGRNLVDAFHALHSRGLCYRDISLNNLFVDPETAEIAICDNDNVGIDGGEVFVKGTNQFMAPEIVRDDAVPSVVVPSLVTDLYSLSVFLFIMFVRGHPLEGIRTESTYSWVESQHVSQHDLMRRHFGLDPLFVFDPKDSSNCPLPGSPMFTYWNAYPEFFKAKFTRAFTTGLMDASLTGRITAGEWRGALARLSDSVAECRCTAAVFYDRDNPGQKCWNCNDSLEVPPLLELSGNTIVLCPDAVVTSHHLNRDKRHDSHEAIVESYPGRPNELTLRNLSASSWTVELEEGGQKIVEPAQRLHVRPMTINFGPTRGTIRVAGALKGVHDQAQSPRTR